MTSKLSFFVGSKKKRAKKYSQFEGNESPCSVKRGGGGGGHDVLGDLCTCGRGRSRKQKNDNKMPRYHVVAIGETEVIGKNELLLQVGFLIDRLVRPFVRPVVCEDRDDRPEGERRYR